MQLIKGTTILLHSANSIEEVANVLIGEHTTTDSVDMTLPGAKLLGYTLGIPKGDTHDWTDRIVDFFGHKFRTIGLPEQGISENIPLSWDKNVKVELMRTNGACTIYKRDTFERYAFEDVYLFDNRGEKATKGGAVESGELKVYIYSACNKNEHESMQGLTYADLSAFTHKELSQKPLYKPTIGDIVVDGICSFMFDTSSEKTISESMQAFRKENNRYAVISSMSVKTSGGVLPDYEITAR